MKLFVTAIFALSSYVTASVPVASMVDSSGEIDLLQSKKIEPTKGLTRSSPIKCQLVLKAPPNHLILLHINNVNINTTSKYEGFDIFDEIRRPEESLYGNRLTEESLKGQYVDYLASENSSIFRDFKSSGRYMTISLYAYLTPQNPGFNITAVPYMEPQNGSCAPNYFMCKKNEICISVLDRCDQHASCGLGDQSDEEGCRTTDSDDDDDDDNDMVEVAPVRNDDDSDDDKDRIIVASVTSIVAVVIIVIVIVCVYRIRRTRCKRTNELEPVPVGVLLTPNPTYQQDGTNENLLPESINIYYPQEESGDLENEDEIPRVPSEAATPAAIHEIRQPRGDVLYVYERDVPDYRSRTPAPSYATQDPNAPPLDPNAPPPYTSQI